MMHRIFERLQNPVADGRRPTGVTDAPTLFNPNPTEKKTSGELDSYFFKDNPMGVDWNAWEGEKKRMSKIGGGSEMLDRIKAIQNIGYSKEETMEQYWRRELGWGQEPDKAVADAEAAADEEAEDEMATYRRRQAERRRRSMLAGGSLMFPVPGQRRSLLGVG